MQKIHLYSIILNALRRNAAHINLKDIHVHLMKRPSLLQSSNNNLKMSANGLLYKTDT